MSQNKTKTPLILLLMVMTSYMIAASLTPIFPAIAALTEYYSDYAPSTVMLISTLPSLVCILGNLTYASVMRRLGYKKGLILAWAIYMGGTLLSYFCFKSFPIVMLGRILFGIAYGFLYPVSATLVMNFIHPDKQGTCIGMGTTISTISGTLLTMVAGFVIGRSLRAVFLVNLIYLIPFLAVILTPDRLLVVDQAVQAADASAEKTAAGAKERFGKASLFWIAFLPVLLLFGNVINLYSSFVVTGLGGTAAQTSLVISIFLVAGALGSFVYGQMVKLLGDKLITVLCLLSAIGFILIFLAKSVGLIYVGTFISGVGFMTIMPHTFYMIGISTPQSRIADANGIVSAALNVASFLCPYAAALIMTVFHLGANYKALFAVSAIVFALFSVGFIANSLKKKA